MRANCHSFSANSVVWGELIMEYNPSLSKVDLKFLLKTFPINAILTKIKEM